MATTDLIQFSEGVEQGAHSRQRELSGGIGLGLYRSVMNFQKDSIDPSTDRRLRQ